MIEQIKGILIEQQQLCVDGRVFDNEETLASLNMGHHTILELLISLEFSLHFADQPIILRYIAYDESFDGLESRIRFATRLFAEQYHLFLGDVEICLNHNTHNNNTDSNGPQRVADIPHKATLRIERKQQITVFTPCDTPLHLDVQLSDSIHHIKMLIENKTEIPIAHQTLLLRHNVLEDDHTLATCNIHFYETLELALDPDESSMTIFVKTVVGQTHTFHIERFNLVSVLRQQIQDKGVPLQRQQIVFAGHLLDPYRTLKDYNIKPETTLHIALRSWGGMSYRTAQSKDPIPNEHPL